LFAELARWRIYEQLKLPAGKRYLKKDTVSFYSQNDDKYGTLIPLEGFAVSTY
jgi:hypothetical protein